MATVNDARLVTEFTTPTDLEVVATRVFDAPRRVVWDAFTRPEHVTRWMLGPDGWTMPVCEIDLRPGGAWRFVWRKNDGEEMEMTGEYREVTPVDRLVNTERWGGDWAETLNTLLLTEHPDGRTLTVSTVLYPSKEARDRALETGMKEGWGQSYDRLDEHLAANG
ncbi:MAG TPA: SRPBCC family protein [Longimicrobium sp.]|nr:SRPBCC family protein [Longimicrobium sp.]